ncbi:MAG: peptide chain release factor N(5)-glutamine methyltransferase [Ruminococcaceae bacterium]|nr:peptide chain release factor N(5)-glutamine methyltransferase [Oscillospiraceae bacterium]
MVIAEALQEACRQLAAAGITSARLDSEVLLSFLLKKERLYLLLHKHDALGEDTLSDYEALIKRRAAGEPVAYLVGEKEFMSLPFAVRPGILIPRPDTETLVESVIARYQTAGKISVLDLCTGSGAIAVSLAYYLPQSHVTACDISELCVETTRENACKNGVSDRVLVVLADVLGSLPFCERFDCVVSNPPYIPTQALAGLERDVRDFEPTVALDGGVDGLLFYRRLSKLAPQLLKPGGLLALEVGHDQAESVCALLVKAGFSGIETLQDLAGISRVVCGVL